MPRPTFNPRSSIHGISIQAGSIDSTAIGAQVVVAADISDGAISTAKLASTSVISPKIGTAAVGLTASATVIKRRAHTVSLGQQTTGGIKNRLVFIAPPSGATILAAKVNAGTLMYHAAGEADTWILQLRNQSAAVNLVKNNASLSGVTLGLTAFKTLPVNNGNSSMLAGAGLYAQLSVSGTAQTLVNASVHIEWTPLNNA